MNKHEIIISNAYCSQQNPVYLWLWVGDLCFGNKNVKLKEKYHSVKTGVKVSNFFQCIRNINSQIIFAILTK